MVECPVVLNSGVTSLQQVTATAYSLTKPTLARRGLCTACN